MSDKPGVLRVKHMALTFSLRIFWRSSACGSRRWRELGRLPHEASDGRCDEEVLEACVQDVAREAVLRDRLAAETVGSHIPASNRRVSTYLRVCVSHEE